MTTRQPFSPLNHKILYGPILIEGYAQGTYLDIKPNADIANSGVGADANFSTNLIADGSATATLKMGYDNPSYKLMRLAAVALQQSGIFSSFTSVNVDDPADTTFSASSHIIRYSTDSYSVNASDMYRTYDIMLHNAIRV